jgi:protein gp37
MGVTVENANYAFRIDQLRQTPAAIKFISFEPLLGPIPNINLEGIDWVIVGGESGPGARPMNSEWAVDIRNQCLAADIPFFFKQWGGVNKKKNGRVIEGQTWSQTPRLQDSITYPLSYNCNIKAHCIKILESFLFALQYC